jgi:hypothetical protein
MRCSKRLMRHLTTMSWSFVGSWLRDPTRPGGRANPCATNWELTKDKVEEEVRSGEDGVGEDSEVLNAQRTSFGPGVFIPDSMAMNS